ncbi:NgoBV family restriction endonuclease [Candidatus Tisiphia endosymbiont of Ptychoptera albimana]|uniref:NgoBV family restriction endonuclease n=1 Tax=Candidatus Tisiphia endosymbiont of Ptychoptera albimana TaxID=3066260 RepID=UPI00312CB532
MSAKLLFDSLQNIGICGAKGNVYFELHNIKTIVRDNSIIGNVIQEWLKYFMNEHNITYRLPDNSQEFPDFYMDGHRNDINLLEVKCFTKSPNFDVANFVAYCRSIAFYPYRLNADYLIFEYAALKSDIMIKNIWLKKVWEICCPSERSALRIQWKQNQTFNIRPATWYAKNPSYKPFNSRLEFVTALKKVLDTHPVGGEWRNKWFQNICNLYKKQTGDDL